MTESLRNWGFPSRRCRSAIFVAAVTLAAAGCRETDAPPIRAQIVNNLVLLDTRVNGTSPALFVLDTGASTSVIDTALAKRLALPLGGGLDVSTGGGSIAAAKLSGVELRIGEVSVSDPGAIALDLSSLSAGLGMPIGGILGFEVFRQFVVEIDYSGERVRFRNPARYEPAIDARSVPVHLEGQIPFVDIVVRNNGRSANARVELDTGLTGALTLLRPFMEQSGLRSPGQIEVPIVTGALLPGKVPAAMTRTSQVAIAGIELAHVLTNVAPDAEAAGLSGAPVGLIGGDLLRRFDVAIDYSRHRMLLSTSDARLRTPMEFDMSGMSLAAQGEDYREYRVRMVIGGSPAAEAGVRAGDLLTAVDGKPTRDVPLGELRQLFRLGEQTYNLELRRDGATRHVAIRTRRLV